MEQYTKDQRVQILKVHYKYGECYAETVRRLNEIFGNRNAPNVSTVHRLVKKFEDTESTVKIKSPGADYGLGFALEWSKILSMVWMCADEAVEDIYVIFCFMFNRSLCASY
ncbi:hypothetical protein C0J52_25378 [Blattella germanica]|nr:hypothetical protein C0J52_25378 [Blattella germanica]